MQKRLPSMRLMAVQAFAQVRVGCGGPDYNYNNNLPCSTRAPVYFQVSNNGVFLTGRDSRL